MKSRRMLLLGGAELLVAAALIYLTLRIPASEGIERGFDRADGLADRTRDRLELLRQQIATLRGSPLLSDSKRLAAHTRTIAGLLESSRIDFESVRRISNAVEQVRRSIDPANDPLSLDKLRQLAAGMAASADFMDKNLADGADRSADRISVTLAGLETSARALAKVLETSAPDLAAVRDVCDGLERFDSGLGKLGELFDPKKMATIREGLGSMETTLRSTADSADKISGFRYPQMKIDGLRPQIEMKPFWPDGKTVADGLRNAAAGSATATDEMIALEKSLPILRTSLDESRASIRRTRETLGRTLANRKEIEAVLNLAPKRAAEFAEALPNAGRELVSLMRETGKLREVAKSLRTFEGQLLAMVEKWPDVQRTMASSSAMLAETRARFDDVLAHRDEYQNALAGSATLAKTFAAQLPEFVERMTIGMEQQENSVMQLQTGIGEVKDELPEVRRTTLELLMGLRILAWLIVGLTLTHAIHSLSAAAGRT